MLHKLFIAFYFLSNYTRFYAVGYRYNSKNNNNIIKLFADQNKINTLATTSIDTNLNILKEAIFKRSINKDEIIQNIIELESKVINNNQNSKLIDLKGSWELVFSSLIPSGYFPVSEVCNFFGYSLTSNWGFISLGGFNGYSKVMNDNPVIIEFNSQEYIFPGKLLKIQLKGDKIRSYNFLFINEEYAVARSYPSNGLTLMKKK